MVAPADVLRFLAGVAPAGRAAEVVWDVRTAGPTVLAHTNHLLTPSRALLRWRKTVRLHAEEQPGRRGLVWLAGPLAHGGTTRRVLVPLLEGTVTDPATAATEELRTTAAADELGLDVEALLGASSTGLHAGELPRELVARMPRLLASVRALAGAGAAPDRIGVVVPDQVVDGDELWLCLTDGLFVEHAPPAPPVRRRLLAWVDETVEGTAFDALYRLDGALPGEPVEDDDPTTPRSPLPLNDAQRTAVLAARSQPVTVVSGAPGTGKSHTAIAIALDAVAAGHSVLVATRSAHAAEVLTDLLDRHPGPTPVRFGGEGARRRLADRLAAGLPPSPSGRELADAEEAERTAADAVRRVRTTLDALLDVAADGARGSAATEALLRTRVPGAFTTEADHGQLLRLLERAAHDGGLLGGWRAGRAADRARRATGAGPDVDVVTLRAAVERSRARRLADEVERSGGLDLAPVWDELADAEEALRLAVGRRLDLAARDAATRRSTRAVAGLAAALRSGIHRRAEQLGRLDAAALTTALPLWVGTVAEVEQLLPRQPGMFELVVLDEASQLDQLAAAPALCRAMRTVVLGDPRQLRHVSFVADADVDAALADAGVTGSADRLDVRRVSAFDAAAAVAPVRWLDDHLRSVPHLIEFSADRFYDEHLHVATRHPRVESRDCIDTVHVDGTLVDGVVPEEVDEVLALVHAHAARRDGTTLGVLTPFRAQADAIEARVLEEVDLDALEALRLRVGTVHAFQGGERDHVVLSVGVTGDGAPQRRAFAEDPNLWNVAVTRARRGTTVVTALPSGTDGLVGAYLDHAERPPSPPVPAPHTDRWTLQLQAELERAGAEVRPRYPVGRFEVDLCVGAGEHAVAVLTRPHPDGTGAEIARRRTLVHAGWRVVEAYRTVAGSDVVATALRLGDLVRPPG